MLLKASSKSIQQQLWRAALLAFPLDLSHDGGT